MASKLSPDQRQALRARPMGPVPVVDDATHRKYVIVDWGWHERAAHALENQEHIAALNEGIRDAEAGRLTPFGETDARMRVKLGMPARS